MSTIRERNGKWQALVRIKKDGRIVHAESRTFATKALAADWATRLEKLVSTKGVEARKTSRTTFADLLDKYRVMRAEVKPLGRSVAHDLDLLEKHLGDKPVTLLTSMAWANFARMRRSEGAGPATVLHNLSTARSVLNTARPLFEIDTDGGEVASAIKQLSNTGHVAPSLKRDRRATDAELDALVREFKRIAFNPSTKIPMDRIVPLAVALPRRISELCAMRWEDYDGRVVTLRDTKHPRIVRTEQVPVPRAAREIIDALPRFDALILPYKSDSVSASFDRACERLSIRDLHLHDLRHEGICRLFEQQLNIPEVAMISGHVTWSTLKRYTHLKPNNVLEKLDARP